MAKVTLTPIVSGFATVTQNNANLVAIAAAIENTLSRDGTAPNTMTGSIDMNSQRILNLPNGTLPGEPLTIRQHEAGISPATAAAETARDVAIVAQLASEAAATTSLNSATNSQNSAVASAASANVSAASALSASGSATSATNAAILAQSYTVSGFGGTLLDLGFVADPTIYFPTDLGVLP